MERVGRRPRRVIFLWAIALLLLATAPSAFAGGRKEDRLSTVDKLIAERKYNEAILALTAFIKEQPNRFDDAQKRLQRIVRLRDEYNTIAEDLLDVLVNDPTNDERKLTMIRRLEALEAAPNRAAREFILRTKETALFTYNRAQFEKIMAEGRSLIDSGDFVGAARRYTDGFSLYREEFYQAGYGDLIVSRVDSGLEGVAVELDRFETLFSRLEKATADLEVAAGAANAPAGLAPLSLAYEAVEPVLLEFAAIRNAVAAAGRGFENQFLLLQGADKTLGDSSFLPFAFRFILGRKTEIRPEGIMGTMDTLWTERLNRIQKALAQAAAQTYVAAQAQAAAGQNAAAGAAFASLADYGDLALRAASVWSAVAGAEITPALTNYGRSIVAGKPQEFLQYQTLIRAARFLADAQQGFLDLAAVPGGAGTPLDSWLAGTLAPAQAVEAELALRGAYQEIAARAEAALNRIAGEEGLVAGYADQNLVRDEAGVYLADARHAYEKLAGDAYGRDGDTAVRRYRIATGDLERRLEAYRGEEKKGLELLAGLQVSAADGTSYLGKYPAEALPVFTALDQAAARDLQTAAALLTAFTAEAPRLTADDRIDALVRNTQAGVAALQALQSQARAAAAQARDRIGQADSLRLEGDRRYQEARAALGRLAFDVARERAQQSGERYDASLAIQDSSALRAERDQKLLALSAEISKIENEVVVRDVRRLINQGKTAYYAGNFALTEETLVQAQLRWRTTNVEDEPEVAYWLTLARGALALKTGRTILKTAPLYAEMSQLLSGAQKAFEEGRKLLSARRKTDALVLFDEAKRKIQEVRIVFPINQEASLLNLRIDQLVDPEAFNASFRSRFLEARNNLKTQPQQAYSDLLDLAEINSRYPGLKTAIEKAEIDLGLRLPPPDQRALARSAELVRSAKRIVDANIRAQFPVALEQLNEALKLNPNNSEAGTLKDRIQTDVGGQAVVVLTSASEREYQRAVQELQRGNTIVALAIVEQLLQDPRNQNSSRILELQRRIQARL